MFLMPRELAMAGLALAGLSLAGCGSNETDTAAGPKRSKAAATVIVDGSSTVYRISKAAQEAFEAVDPEITVVVDNHGTGGGFSRYLQGEVDIVDASRAAKPDEESKAKAQGIEWTRFVVGYDGITLVVNPKNDFVKSLTVDQLKKRSGSPEARSRPGRTSMPPWPDRKIILYSPDNDSGTFEFFTEAIVGKAKSQRDDVQQSSDDNTLVSGVAGDADGLGYFGYAYYRGQQGQAAGRGRAERADAKPVLPSPATIADKSYTPLSRPLFIYVKNSAARRPEVAQFLKFYIENIDEAGGQGGIRPADRDELKDKDTLAKLTGRDGTPAAKLAIPASE